MNNSSHETQQINWLEIDARGPNDGIHLEWGQDSDQFRVRVDLPDFIGQTPPLPYEEAREDFWHINVAKHLGRISIPLAA